MAQRSIGQLLKQEWDLIAHTVDTILPKSANFRFLLLLALVIVGLSLLTPRERQPTGPAPFSRSEQEAIASLMRDNGWSREKAERVVLNNRPTAEEQRRFEYERKQREQAAEAIQVGLCQSQPWLDRCQ